MSEGNYTSTHTGQEIDNATTAALNPDTEPRLNSDALITSGAVEAADARKVDKAEGMGLSENSFTDAEKAKLAGIEAGAQVNTITGVKGGAEANFRTGNVNITKADVGLGSVDNTPDASKPVSGPQAAAISAAQAAAEAVGEEAAADVNANIAADYDGTKDYAENDYAMFDGELRRFTADAGHAAYRTSDGKLYRGDDGKVYRAADAPQTERSTVGKALSARAMSELLRRIYAAFPTETISDAAVASFTDGADGIPVADLTAAIMPVQAGSGDPAPDNVRPITGFACGNVVVSPTQDAQDGTTYAVTFGDAGTVYVGTLDVTTGQLTVTEMTVDMGTLTWNRAKLAGTDDIYRFNAYMGGIQHPMAIATAPPDVNCSIYKPVGASDLRTTDKAITTAAGYANVYVRDDAYTTEQAFTAAVSGGQILYKLATPIEVQISPVEIRTLYGQNYIWADVGSVSVEYRADVELYIEKKLEAL